MEQGDYTIAVILIVIRAEVAQMLLLQVVFRAVID
jgi:hypothetical protein